MTFRPFVLVAVAAILLLPSHGRADRDEVRVRTVGSALVAASSTLQIDASSAQKINHPCAGYPPMAPEAYARLYVACAQGWGADEFSCLDWLWDHESSWKPTAHRAAGVNGSYGIPQANPGTKMASAGPDWRTNPRPQIRWGAGYIAGRYRTPCAAKARWVSRSPHWY